MPKSLVGRVKNKKFAFFWFLIGGGIGNLLITLYSPEVWPMLLPPAILSILIAITAAGDKRRPKFRLGIDLLLTVFLLMALVSLFGAQVRFGIFLPSVLIIFGCILGIMDW